MKKHADTHQRALAVNLDPTSYGTFAEIGAGQEVARWFLQVGGAAGTVAKTISAYDMAFSDAIYGKSGRYVSRDRLVEMLDHEYELLLSRLGAARGKSTRFFVFADTVSARNYSGTNECHGWLGLRFQTKPGAKPSDIVLHVNLRDETNLRQQHALGILGVNLVYTAFFAEGDRRRVLEALFAGLSLERVEVDYVELSGPAFARADEAAIGVELVRSGLANAVVLTRAGKLVAPTEFLRKSPIVLERRVTRTVESDAGRRLSTSARQLARDCPDLGREPLALFEISLPSAGSARVPPATSILQHCAKLRARGFPVLVTRCPQGFALTEYLRRYTREPLALTVGVTRLVEMLEAAAERERSGGVFELLGHLQSANVRTFVEPLPAREFAAALRRAGVDPKRVRFPTSGTVHADDLGLPSPLDHLLAYLLAAGWIVPLRKTARAVEFAKQTARHR